LPPASRERTEKPLQKTVRHIIFYLRQFAVTQILKLAGINPSMDSPIREHQLPNGLTVSFHDLTRRYFGDFYLVKLEIVCNVPVISAYFQTEEEYSLARSLLGDEVVYRRSVEQMGVPSTEIERVRERLMADFEKHSLPYFSAATFPRKLVVAELGKMQKKMNRLHFPRS
jgi:hypothetical protein